MWTCKDVTLIKAGSGCSEILTAHNYTELTGTGFCMPGAERLHSVRWDNEDD